VGPYGKNAQKPKAPIVGRYLLTSLSSPSCLGLPMLLHTPIHAALPSWVCHPVYRLQHYRASPLRTRARVPPREPFPRCLSFALLYHELPHRSDPLQSLVPIPPFVCARRPVVSFVLLGSYDTLPERVCCKVSWIQCNSPLGKTHGSRLMPPRSYGIYLGGREVSLLK
jgi:hypothetical protein